MEIIDGVEMATTEDELLSQEKVMDEQTGRDEDIKKMWFEFDKFRRFKKDFENQAYVPVKDRLNDVSGKKVENWKIDRAVELVMLFAYGVELAKASHPKIATVAPYLNIRIVGDEAPMVTSFAMRRIMLKTTGATEEYAIQARYLLNPENQYSHVASNFVDNTRKSASELIPDYLVVETIAVAAEEYAHLVFAKIKSPEKVERADQQQNQTTESYLKLKNEGKIDEAYETYHSGDIERRALLWKTQVLEKRLPHWAGPAKEFEMKIANLRSKKNGPSHEAESEV